MTTESHLGRNCFFYLLSLLSLRYTRSTRQWVWIAGTAVANVVPVYPITLGESTAVSTPGGRYDMMVAVDSTRGVLMLWGCYVSGYRGDLWSFSPSTLQWRWEAGTQQANQPPLFAQGKGVGIAASSQGAGGRHYGVASVFFFFPF